MERTVGMSSQSETDYEKLYHLMNRRRGEELQKLKETYDSFTDLYVGLVLRDKLFHNDSISWERNFCSEAMLLLTRLMDTFTETDRLMEYCVETQGEPVIEMILGGKEMPHGAEKCACC